MIRGPKPKRGVSLLFHRPSCKQSRRNQGDDLTPILPYLQNTRIAAKQHSGHKAAKATCIAQGGNKPRLEICNEMLKMKRPPKTPDRAYPLVKNQEYAYAYDWEYRPG